MFDKQTPGKQSVETNWISTDSAQGQCMIGACWRSCTVTSAPHTPLQVQSQSNSSEGALSSLEEVKSKFQKCSPWSLIIIGFIYFFSMTSWEVYFLTLMLVMLIFEIFTIYSGSCRPGQAEQPTAGAEGPRGEGAEGGEGAAREGVGRVQNENSLLWIRGETSAV